MMSETVSVSGDDWEKFKKWYDGKQKRSEAKKQERAQTKIKVYYLDDSRLVDELKGLLPKIQWTKQDNLLGMKPNEKVDILGRPNKSTYAIFIEIEKMRPTSIFNVIKSWSYLEHVENSVPILFIQLFSEFVSSGSRRTLMQHTIFTGEQAHCASNKFYYKHLQKENWPQHEGENPVKMAKKIAEIIDRYENQKKDG